VLGRACRRALIKPPEPRARMLDSLRKSLSPALGRLGRAAASTGLSPSAWTAIGLAASAAAAALFGLGAGLALAMAGVALLASGFFDIVDGQVARATNTQSRRGAFLDSVSDRVAEAAAFVGMAVGGVASPQLVVLAAVLSLIVSYTRARAESLGVGLAGVGVGERAERLAIIAVAAIIAGAVQAPHIMDYALALVCALAGITIVQRAVRAHRGLDA